MCSIVGNGYIFKVFALYDSMFALKSATLFIGQIIHLINNIYIFTQVYIIFYSLIYFRQLVNHFSKFCVKDTKSCITLMIQVRLYVMSMT